MQSVFPPEMAFRYTWRPYQARVLAELEDHLEDEKLHVVAAPGSGKTILGLETVRRIGQPALVLSPTITIRNQWLDRLAAMFFADGRVPDGLVSTDIRTPRPFTSVTYQALHGAATGEAEDATGAAAEEEEGGRKKRRAERVDVAALLRAAGIRAVVLDECHHLRSEWWKVLTETIESLDRPRVVALTATPPYDVPPQEWERYQALCGPVDAEISVPELVADRNLCPHEDYIWFSRPSAAESGRVKAFYAETRAYLARLAADPDFVHAVRSHPFLERPEEHIEEILDRCSYFSALAVFLNYVDGRPPERLVRAMGLRGHSVPRLTAEWWEELLTGCLFDDAESFDAHREAMERVRRDLSRLGAVERRSVVLRSTREITKLLAASLSKLESVRAIVEMEHRSLGPALRRSLGSMPGWRNSRPRATGSASAGTPPSHPGR